MSDTILGGDFTVFYAAENNQQRLKWSGSQFATRSMNELYSALQSLFDDSAQMDDRDPMKADTPDIYRIQKQWFVDDDSVEHLTGGTIFSDGWQQGSTEHVLILEYAQTTEFSEADIGRTIEGLTTGDTGTILDFNATRTKVWVRPDDPTSGGDEFDNATESYQIFRDPWAAGIQEDNSGGPSFIDETTDLNSAAANDVAFFPAGAGVNDAFYFGYGQQFSMARINVGTAGTGTYTLTWEYWNGTAWTALSGVTDGTTDFKTGGTNNVTYTVPTDWVQTTVNGQGPFYYIRARRDAGTVTADPLGTQAFATGVGAGAFTVASAAGESSWTGINTITTLQANSHFYIAQDDPDTAGFQEQLVVATKGTSDWWENGDIDILLKTREAGVVLGESPTQAGRALANFFIRRYGNATYNFFTPVMTPGGNSVVPIETGQDLDNTTGYRTVTTSSSSGNWAVGNRIQRYVLGDWSSVLQEDSSGPTFVDETTDANSAAASDWQIFPAGAGANDAAYFGFTNPSGRIQLNIATAGTGTYTVTWEYWNGSAWVALTLLSSVTTAERDFKTTGTYTIDFVQPAGGRQTWKSRSVNNSPDLFFVRARRDGGTVTLDPLGTQTQSYQAQAASAVITSTTGANPTITIRYFLINDPITDFANTELIVNLDDTGEATSGTPANFGPALDGAITIVHGATTEDLGNGNGARPYSVRINPASLSVARAYERSKYVTRRGETGTGSTDGQQGQFYIGNVLQIEYDTQTGNYAEGLEVTGGTSGAQGIIVADHDDGADGDLILRTVRGTFQVGEILTDTATGSATIASLRTIAPTKAAPFGTFAGGTFFLAPGVTLTTANIIGGEERAFQQIDDDGVTQIPPNNITVALGNMVAGDQAFIAEVDNITDQNIVRNQHSLAAGNAEGNSTVVVDVAIPTDTPGNGKIRCVQVSTGREDRYRYASFTGSTFTLAAASTGTSNGGNSSATRLHDTTATFITDGVEVGDLVRNTTEGTVARVINVVSETELDTETVSGFPAVVSWSGDAYSINTLIVNYVDADTAYVPFVDRVADAAQETSATFTYGSDIPMLFSARNAGVILPFDTAVLVSSTGQVVSVIRNPDDIFT